MRITPAVVSILFALFLQGFGGAAARPDEDDAPALYYCIERNGRLYARPDRTAPLPGFRPLALQEPLFLLEALDGWLHVRTADDATGFVPAQSVSNVWLRVSKKRQMLFVYRGAHLETRIPIDLGLNAIMDKERRGGTLEPDHWRTPEGNFRIVAKNPNSKFHKALVLNYPSAEDAERGLRSGLIDEAEYRAILRAEAARRMPPMHTLLGGYIEIHGHGTGASVNWTEGCIAITNRAIDRLWPMVHVGTPVLVE